MDGENKKGIHHVVKLLTFWDKDENFLCAHQLDTDAAFGTNKGATEDVHYSFKKIDTNDSKVMIHGKATHVGRGGVGDGLVDELRKLDRINSGACFSITYSLHTLNLMLYSPVNTFMGSGGNQKRTLLQILHTCYVLQEER